MYAEVGKERIIISIIVANNVKRETSPLSRGLVGAQSPFGDWKENKLNTRKRLFVSFPCEKSIDPSILLI